MEKLLVFSDLDGTINEASLEDFIILFGLIDKYCEKKGYDKFSFDIVTGGGSFCRELYVNMLLEIKKRTGQEFELSVFPNLLPGAKKGVIESVVSCEALPRGYDVSDDELGDVLIAKEVIYFDDDPHNSLKDLNGKNYFESLYDIEFECVVPTKNFASLIEYFENKLSYDDSKKPFVKTDFKLSGPKDSDS